MMSQIDIDFTDALYNRDCDKIIKAIWYFANDLKRSPGAEYAQMNDLTEGRGRCLCQGLSFAVENNFQEGVIMLFDPKRAAHVLAQPISQGKNGKKGRAFLEDLVLLFAENFNGVNKTLHDFLAPPTNGNYWVDPSKRDAVIQSVLTTYASHRQRQTLTNEIDQHMDEKSTNLKKKM